MYIRILILHRFQIVRLCTHFPPNFTSIKIKHVDALEHGLVNMVRKWLTNAVKARIDSEGSKPSSQESVKTVLLTWNLILNWVKSKVMVSDIPTTHLFPGPAVLQDECLKMFYVDQSWLDAFVDGALRLANLVTFLSDPIERSINEFLRKSFAKF